MMKIKIVFNNDGFIELDKEIAEASIITKGNTSSLSLGLKSAMKKVNVLIAFFAGNTTNFIKSVVIENEENTIFNLTFNQDMIITTSQLVNRYDLLNDSGNLEIKCIDKIDVIEPTIPTGV